ncbi:MAG TPA: AzlD domain-containing protein [Ramlibacter sp.]|nr:AzlD domain-containing protein [Ramlibacter sp.]
MSFAKTDFWTLGVILGLACVTVIARCFFFISSRPWPLPAWVERGLQYAPIAALSAVVVPEVLMAQGQLITTWHDARIFGAAAGMAVFFWRRDVLATILVGMAVYLPLLLLAGW